MKLKNYVLILIACLQSFTLIASPAEDPGAAYLFAYSTNDGKSGLCLAWSTDKENWHAIGPDHCFLFSDFGTWGSQKRMYDPYLFQDKSGLWHCIWSLNKEVNVFAHAASKNLYEWKRQSYPQVMDNGNFIKPEVFYDNSINKYAITWLSNQDDGVYQTTTTDFKNYTATEKIDPSKRQNNRVDIILNGRKQSGVVYSVKWDVVEDLIKHEEWLRFHNNERAENLNDDAVKYKDLKPLEAQITLKPEQSKSISDLLVGVFFEDINYAADGGLYAELIQNRDFEYKVSDTKYRDKTWTSTKAWSVNPEHIILTIETKEPIHKNNPHYAVLDVKQPGSGLVNEGFDGIPVKQGDKYDISVFAKSLDSIKSNIVIRLKTPEGETIGEAEIKNISQKWEKYKGNIKAERTVNNAVLEVIPTVVGKLALDMISLFPQKTFKGRKNGLRADLAQAIADINPKFVRFPGGCVAHGDGLDNIYRWKNTIGPLEARVPQPNIWGYHQTVGLGYYEYFRFCEAINAEPLPVLAAGVPCQNSSTGGHGQQCGIPMEAMDDYVQDVLDLIEWANGDKNTKWGNLRVQAGHPEPFNLKYIGIGNEDLITDVFEERFAMIFSAVKERHPEITVIGTVGPFYMGTDYEEGWDLATRLKVPMVDEHYYQPPGWFINNQDYYDAYDRNKAKVYLGEYAAHVDGRRMNMQTALSEALYLTAIERNGDVVHMTSFAPLLAKRGHTQWNPDLIYFTNTEVKLTTDYYVQQLYGTNSGDIYIPNTVSLPNEDENIQKRIGVSVVEDSKTGDLILKLVNVLPVAVSLSIDLQYLGIDNAEADLTVLQGQPNDENLKPSVGTLDISQQLSYEMLAYSFSVIRIKRK